MSNELVCDNCRNILEKGSKENEKAVYLRWYMNSDQLIYHEETMDGKLLDFCDWKCMAEYALMRYEQLKIKGK